MLCQLCTERKTCQKLCPEAELFVKQDYVPRDGLESISPSVDFVESVTDEDGTVWDYQKEYYPPKKLKLLIRKLHKEGKNSYEIAYHLSCSRQYIDKVIATKSKAK